MKKIYFYLFILILIAQSCTEPYALQTENFENLIVIEASITNQFKKQEVKVSRTYPSENNSPEFETGATVFVTDSNGNQYYFVENSGVYVSAQQFQAQPNITYKLTVITSDGKTYTSKDEKIASTTELETITTSVGTNGNEGNGVKIIANMDDSTEGIKYYRYTYEETNKVISPQWRDYMGEAVYFSPRPNSPPFGEVLIKPWPYESKICYTTENSKDIIQYNTSLSTTNNNSFQVRFISDQNYKIAHRYSIEVTLHNQSLAAYNYYEALKKSSTQGNILSQNQPGFYSGNIKNINNPNEKIIGFFEVSHISKKRIFFNFEDVFPNQSKPQYPYHCPEIPPPTSPDIKNFLFYFYWCYPPPTCDPLGSGDYILYTLNNKLKAVYEFDITAPMNDIPNYTLVNSQCIDCTTFSSNIKPSFWID
ncbi:MULTISPECIES: DUF4249 domain-containing protein [Flavobacterium]|uniref:DUF4249 domain-containing protein n=1 Tax=Flavobacterium hankyongi TaxID=1176532 RepID=A0ABP8ZUB1_9FLAO|nr:DUF4249 domain-containing protein [Flavobacterium sp. N1846]